MYRASAMSRLAYPEGDDYPEASTKHLADAVVLNQSGRYDGCVYHAGYVVECALKSVLLYQMSWVPQTGEYDRKKFVQAQIRLTEISHGLQDLLRELGRVRVEATTQSSPYLPDLSGSAAIMKWRPSHRYRRAGHRARDQAQAMLDEAQRVWSQTIDQMMKDRVI